MFYHELTKGLCFTQSLRDPGRNHCKGHQLELKRGTWTLFFLKDISSSANRTKAGTSASIFVCCLPLFLIACLHTGTLTIQRVSIKSILFPSRLKAETNYYLKPPATLNSRGNPQPPSDEGNYPQRARKHTGAEVIIFDEYDQFF